MKNPRFACSTVALTLLTGSMSAEVLHDVDFTSHDVETYGTVYGNPTVQSWAGPFQNALVFSATDRDEQLRLPINTEESQLNIQYDVMVHNMLISTYTFTLHLESPEWSTLPSLKPSPDWRYQSISLSQGTSSELSGPTVGTGDPMGVRVFQSHYAPMGEYVALWQDDEVYHFDISIDLDEDIWSVAINGKNCYSREFTAPSVDALRFSMRPGPLDDDEAYPATYAMLDNLRVTAVPEPGSLSLIGLGSLAFTSRLLRRGTRAGASQT